MHPGSTRRHQRSQSGRDLDEAVSKLEQARDVLLDAKVKTNEALMRAASTLWHRECRRAPQKFGPQHSLQALACQSRNSSPAESPARSAQANRTLAVSDVRNLAHISHSGVAYSVKARKLEIKKCSMIEYHQNNQRLPNNPDLTTSLEQVIRRRSSKSHSDRLPLYSNQRQPQPLKLGSSRVLPLGALAEEALPMVPLNPSTSLGNDDEPFTSSENTEPSTYNISNTVKSKSQFGSSKDSGRSTTLTDIRSQLQKVQDQLYHVPDVRRQIATSSLQPSPSQGPMDSTSTHPSNYTVRSDLKNLELNTREVLEALSRRYKR